MKNIRNILITGGTGSFGTAALEFFLKKNSLRKIIIFSRDELKQSEMRKKFKSEKIRYFIGDVRDYKRILIATKNVDLIIHAAALKQVDTAEYNPTEFIQTNIMGAQNIIEACSQNNIKKVIALSTDKACSPINLYGATKLCSDKLFIAANNYIPTTKFSLVRYGNVEGSRGSVIPFFRSIFKKQPFPITSLNMTRFSLSLKKSLEVVDWSIKNLIGGEILVPKIPSYRILDLVKAFHNNSKIKVIGLRPGEKIHEELITSYESEYTIEIKNYYIILPFNYTKSMFDYYYKNFKGEKVKKDFKYSSDTNKNNLSINQLKKIIPKI